MSRPLPKNRWLTILLLIAAVAIWGYQQLYPTASPRRGNRSDTPAATHRKSSQTAAPVGDYEFYQGCKLVEARNNVADLVHSWPGR